MRGACLFFDKSRAGFWVWFLGKRTGLWRRRSRGGRLQTVAWYESSERVGKRMSSRRERAPRKRAIPSGTHRTAIERRARFRRVHTGKVYGEGFSGRCLRIDFSFLLCFYRAADAQCGRREYVGRVRVRQVPQGPDPARAAALPRRGVRSAGRQFPSRALRRLQGQPQRDARRHRRVGSVYQAGARGDAHSGARDSRLRSRRRDRHAVAESGRRQITRCLW